MWHRNFLTSFIDTKRSQRLGSVVFSAEVVWLKLWADRCDGAWRAEGAEGGRHRWFTVYSHVSDTFTLSLFNSTFYFGGHRLFFCREFPLRSSICDIFFRPSSLCSMFSCDARKHPHVSRKKYFSSSALVHFSVVLELVTIVVLEYCSFLLLYT